MTVFSFSSFDPNAQLSPELLVCPSISQCLMQLSEIGEHVGSEHPELSVKKLIWRVKTSFFSQFYHISGKTSEFAVKDMIQVKAHPSFHDSLQSLSQAALWSSLVFNFHHLEGKVHTRLLQILQLHFDIQQCYIARYAARILGNQALPQAQPHLSFRYPILS